MTDDVEPTTHEPTEITYSEHLYPARPRSLRPRARLRSQSQRPAQEKSGEPAGTNPFYVAWLQQESMLQDANTIANQFSGQGSMWQNPYARPNADAAIERAAVWFTAYPLSMITKPGQSFLSTLGDPDLWQTFQRIGIRAIHTGPVKRAGGLKGWDATPSVDGHFDRVSTQIDPVFGSEEEFRAMCQVAGEYDGTVIDDIVPGHTGKGADFRLAEMNVGDYPGIYHMVQIHEEDWDILPKVPANRDSANLDATTEAKLADLGYIIGELQRVIFWAPGVKETNWSATSEVVGPDGIGRRWVYLHYFKQGQPSVNWLDPTFAGMRLVIGDALHSLGDLGSGALRLDANGFLGVEKSADGMPAWSEGHPLSEAANHLIASMVRKVGGFTFQELNLTIDDIRTTGEAGADLSYDFINRPAYHHALATGDTEFLRLTLNLSLASGVSPRSLVHALQNHDELTYELVHFATVHKDDAFTFRRKEILGGDLAVAVRQDLIDTLTGTAAPYNEVFTTNGIASTTATVILGTLGVTSLDDIDDETIERVCRGHLLLAMFNALQPGVFALSGWDLCGMLTLDRGTIESLLATGDTRWLHRAAYDLMGYDAKSKKSASGMPRGISLYGDLPSQLAEPGSFASRLRRILEVREAYSLSTAEQIHVPKVSHRSMLVMVHRLVTGRIQVTVLNFAGEPISGTVHSEHLVPGSVVSDMFSDRRITEVDDLHSFSVTLEAHEGLSLLVSEPASSNG